MYTRLKCKPPCRSTKRDRFGMGKRKSIRQNGWNSCSKRASIFDSHLTGGPFAPFPHTGPSSTSPILAPVKDYRCALDQLSRAERRGGRSVQMESFAQDGARGHKSCRALFFPCKTRLYFILLFFFFFFADESCAAISCMYGVV